MTEPTVVEIERDPPRSAAEFEVRGLVRVEEIRLERAKIRSFTMIVIAGIFGFVGTCYVICGNG